MSEGNKVSDSTFRPLSSLRARVHHSPRSTASPSLGLSVRRLASRPASQSVGQ